MTHFGHHRPVAQLLLAGAALGASVLIGFRASAGPAEQAPVTAPEASLTAPAPLGCWVTGDLAGEGNPADLATARCGQK